METIFTGMALGLLIILQWFMIWECIRMKGTVAEHSTDLRQDMRGMADLLDEAVDFLADNMPKQRSLIAQVVNDAQTTPDIKEVILSALISRMGMSPPHGSTQESQEREIYEEYPQTQQEQEHQLDENR